MESVIPLFPLPTQEPSNLHLPTGGSLHYLLSSFYLPVSSQSICLFYMTLLRAIGGSSIVVQVHNFITFIGHGMIVEKTFVT